MSTSEEDEVIRRLLSMYDGNESSDMHWFGENLRDSSGYLLFSSLYFDETIPLNLSNGLNEADTFIFHLQDSIPFYLKTEIDSVYYDNDLNDSVKSIHLTLLNTLLEEEEINYNIFNSSLSTYSVGDCFIPLLYIEASTINKYIRISKNNGIIEIPNLAFYPYCKSYKKYITVDSLKQMLSTPVLKVGDRFEEVSKNLNSNYFYQYEYATEITAFQDFTQDSILAYSAKRWKKRVPYNGYQNTIIPESTYDSEFILNFHYGYNSYIFNGLDKNKNSESYFLRINSVWGFPFLEKVNGRYLPLNDENYDEICHLVNITDMYSSQASLSGYYSERCLMYYNINGQEHGISNHLDIEKLDPVSSSLQVVYKNCQLEFNYPLTFNAKLYSIEGELLNEFKNKVEKKHFNIQCLNKGIYILRLDNYNQVFKIIVE